MFSISVRFKPVNENQYFFFTLKALIRLVKLSFQQAWWVMWKIYMVSVLTCTMAQAGTCAKCHIFIFIAKSKTLYNARFWHKLRESNKTSALSVLCNHWLDLCILNITSNSLDSWTVYGILIIVASGYS